MSEFAKRIDRILKAENLLAPLVIPSELKSEFDGYYRHRQQQVLETAFLVGLIIYISFLVVDWFVVPDVFWIAVIGKIFITLPVALVTLWLVHQRSLSLYPKYLGSCALAVVMMLQSIWVTSLSETAPSVVYLTSSNVIMVFATTMIGLPFHLALLVSIAAVVLQSGGVLVSPFASFALLIVVISISISIAGPSLYANWCLQNERRRHFLTHKRDELLSRQIAGQRDQLDRLAALDPLTGIANRRGLEAAIEQRLARAGPRDVIAIAMIDIDFFKAFNDRLGHPAGDDALCKVGAVLSETCDQNAFVARLGGEEFAVVWVGIDVWRLRLEGERIRSSVAALQISRDVVPSAEILTVSIGMAAGNASSSTLRQVFAQADKALYEAKSNGRNRIVVHDGAVSAAVKPAPFTMESRLSA